MAERSKSLALALALATLGLATVAAIAGLPSLWAKAPTPACASCDARHMNPVRHGATRAEESTP